MTRYCLCFFVSVISFYCPAGLGQDTFNLSLEELLEVPVSVSSRTEPKLLNQPASVTVIQRDEIERSFVNTLSDLLTLYVPGYFRAEDKDDTIASFRGVAPDNNSKVLLLINGRKVNADWFWGPADAILNGIDLNYIERVEVVRGPGSVTLGQGAQLGAINIITRKFSDTEVNTSIGQQGLYQFSVGGNSEFLNGYRLNWFTSRQVQQGERMANRGWGAEVSESDSDHPSTPYQRGNRYGQADASRLLLQLQMDDIAVDVQHHRQTRHLYNWTKDRDQVENRLTMIGLHWSIFASNSWEANLEIDWQQDDYALYDHSFYITTGGAREQRTHINAEVYWQPSRLIQWVNGVELSEFEQGKRNWQGDNFIVNRISNVNNQNNSENTWAFRDSFWSRALYSELKLETSHQLDFNLGARLDEHPKWGSHLSPRVSALYRPENSNQLWRVSFSEGFHGASGVHYTGGFLRDGLLSESSFSDIGSSGMTSSTTGDLITNISKTNPETLKSAELGWSFSLTDLWFFESVLYHNRFKNIIITESTRNGTPNTFVGTDLVGDWGGMFYFTNADADLEIAGIEFSARYYSRLFEHRLSISNSQILSANGFELGQKSPVAGTENDLHSNGIPELIIRYHGRWNISDSLIASYQHLVTGSWWAPATNEEVSGFGWGSVSMNWTVSDKSELSLQAHNVWDQRSLYPVRARGSANITPGTPALGERRLMVTYHYLIK
ncbi:MAG: TonB-dependent receptor plug domain-containing protein [Gammaproteobacteria bacterium]|nr:TonB-dependent receptor plug domain-containing protein [Gammaproteobacteria bacterium]